MQEISPALEQDSGGGKGRAEPAGATPRQLNGCARVRPWEVRLTKTTSASSPFPHQTLAQQPAPAGRPAARRRGQRCLRELPSGAACPAGARELPGRNPQQPPLPPAQTEGRSRPDVGEQQTAPQSLPSVCAQGSQPRASNAPIPCSRHPSWVSAPGLVARPLRSANAPQESFHPQSGPSFKVGLRAASRRSLRARLPIQSWAPLGQRLQFLP